MALIKCKECGNQVSPKAQSCPRCGARVARKPMGCGTLIAAVLLGAIVLGLGTSLIGPKTSPSPAPPAPTPEQAATKKKQDEALARAQAGAAMLKKAMRDPDSFKLSQALVIDGSGAVCYEYRARNGFGGMNVGYAVISSDGTAFKTENDSGFRKLWQKECANKKGEDIADAINWLN